MHTVSFLQFRPFSYAILPASTRPVHKSVVDVYAAHTLVNTAQIFHCIEDKYYGHCVCVIAWAVLRRTITIRATAMAINCIFAIVFFLCDATFFIRLFNGILVLPTVVFQYLRFAKERQKEKEKQCSANTSLWLLKYLLKLKCIQSFAFNVVYVCRVRTMHAIQIRTPRQLKSGCRKLYCFRMPKWHIHTKYSLQIFELFITCELRMNLVHLSFVPYTICTVKFEIIEEINKQNFRCNWSLFVVLISALRIRMQNECRSKKSIYHFRVLLVGTIPTERLNHFSIHQLQLVDLFHAHRWIRTIHQIFVALLEFRAEMLRLISSRRCRSGGALVAFYCLRFICNA